MDDSNDDNLLYDAIIEEEVISDDFDTEGNLDIEVLDQFTSDEAGEEDSVMCETVNENSPASSNKTRFRRSFTIKRKLEILEDYQPGVSGHGFAAVAKKYGIDSKTLRVWFQKKDELIAQVANKGTRIKEIRRLPGGGRKQFFAQVDECLLEWIRDRNKEGLRVSYKYMRSQALKFAISAGLPNFQASSGYLKRFCYRNKLGSRRQTTTRHLPENADALAMDFIKEVRDFIKEKKIKLCNVLNMDQVPRAFESEPKSTITEKGVHQVLMRKAGSSHKKFTVTFTVSGKFDVFEYHCNHCAIFCRSIQATIQLKPFSFVLRVFQPVVKFYDLIFCFQI